MTRHLFLAAAALLTLGLAGSTQPAQATSRLATAFSAPAESGAPVRNAGGFDGYGFGIHGRGCGWGNGGGTGYNGCFAFERGNGSTYGYRGRSGYAKRRYDRGTYRRGHGYRRGYGRAGRRY